MKDFASPETDGCREPSPQNRSIQVWTHRHMNVLQVPEEVIDRLGWLLVRIAGRGPRRCRGGVAGLALVVSLLVGVAAGGLWGAASAADEAAQSKGQVQKES